MLIQSRVMLLTLSACIASVASAQSECRVEPPHKDAVIVEPYAGGCVNGLAHGEGKYAYKATERGFMSSVELTVNVAGEFREGKLHGKAHITSSIGRSYEGAMSANRADGRGRLYFEPGANFRFQEGEFRDGKFWQGHASSISLGREVDSVFKEGKRIMCRKSSPPAECLELLPRENLEKRAAAQTTAAARRDQRAPAQPATSSSDADTEPVGLISGRGCENIEVLGYSQVGKGAQSVFSRNDMAGFNVTKMAVRNNSAIERILYINMTFRGKSSTVTTRLLPGRIEYINLTMGGAGEIPSSVKVDRCL